MRSIYFQLALCYFKIPHAFNKPDTCNLELRFLHWDIEIRLFRKMEEKMFDILMNGDPDSIEQPIIGIIPLTKWMH